MHNTPYVDSNNFTCMKIGSKVPNSSHYVNQQINRTNKPSSNVNLTES